MNDIAKLLKEVKGLEKALAIVGKCCLDKDEEIYFKIEDGEHSEYASSFSANMFRVDNLHRVQPITITVVHRNRPVSVTVIRYNHMRNKGGKSGHQLDLFPCEGTVLDKEYYELFFPEKEHSNLNAILADATLGHNGINIKKCSHKKNKEFISEINKALRPYYLSTIKQDKGRETATISKSGKDLMPTFLAIYSVPTSTDY